MREVSAAAGLLRLCEGLQLFNGTDMSWTATCSPIDALDVLFDDVCELLDFHGAVAVDTTVGGHLCVRQRQEWRTKCELFELPRNKSDILCDEPKMRINVVIRRLCHTDEFPVLALGSCGLLHGLECEPRHHGYATTLECDRRDCTAERNS